MVGSLSAGLLLADEAGAHLPSVDDFLPPEILFQGTPFAINRIILIRIVATIVLLVVLGVTAKRAKLIPGRWQGVVEYGLDFVRDKVVYDVMGEARGKRYVPMITTLFFTIFIFNLCGIIPGMNMAANATVVMPLVFAVWTLIQYWIAAIRSQGLGHYLRHELFTPGVPWPVYFLLAPINLLELLIIRPASLTIRLFANMVSGHLMVATCLAFAQLNMESLYIRHDVISERKLARLNPDRPVSFRADQAVSRFGTTLGRCPLDPRSSVTHRHF